MVFLVYVLHANGQRFYPMILSRLSDIQTQSKLACVDIDYQVLENQTYRLFMVYNVALLDACAGDIKQVQTTKPTVNWLATQILVERYQLDCPIDGDWTYLPLDFVVFLTTTKDRQARNYSLGEFERDWKCLFHIPRPYLTLHKGMSDRAVLDQLFGKKSQINAFTRHMVVNARLAALFRRKFQFQPPFPEYTLT